MLRLQFDLVRRGIGGKTRAALCAAMSYPEQVRWLAYKHLVIDEYVRAGKKKQTPVPW